MKRTFLLSVVCLICFFSGVTAQHRHGAQVSYGVLNTGIKFIYEIDKVVQLPTIGYYHQKWTHDRFFKFQHVNIQAMRIELTQNDRTEVQKIRLMNFFWGRGMYLKHREFEDDFAFYFQASTGFGIGDLRSERSGSQNNNGEDHYLFGHYTMVNMGFGFEKRINKKLYGNFSADFLMGTLPYLSLNFRVLRNSY